MLLPDNTNGHHARLATSIQRHAVTSPTFSRETISGLSEAQNRSLHAILTILDTVSADHKEKTFIRLVGFGGTGKHQLLRIIDEFFNDRLASSTLKIHLLMDNESPRADANVILSTSLPFSLTEPLPAGATEFVIPHAGFSAKELHARLKAFGVSKPNAWMCGCVADYGLGSFALALGLTMNNSTLSSPIHSVIQEGVPWGSYEDALAENLLVFHPTIKNIRRFGDSSPIEKALRPFLPPGVGQGALPTIRRVVLDLLKVDNSGLEALAIPTCIYQSFNELASKLLLEHRVTGTTNRGVLKVSAELSPAMADKISLLSQDDSLSSDSKLTAIITVLMSEGRTQSPSISVNRRRIDLPALHLEPLAQEIGPPRLTLLLGVFFDALKSRKPSLAYNV
jgi:hypothetical protein